MEHSNSSDRDMSTTIEEDQALRYRLTGAFVWLGLIILVVPIWYNNPAQFDPEDAGGATGTQQTSKRVIGSQAGEKNGHDLLSANDAVATASSKKSGVSPAASAPEPKTAQGSGSNAVSETDTRQTALDKQASLEKNHSATIKPSSEAVNERWIIRVAAFHKKDDAEALEQRLKYDYETFIKYFPSSRYYSVRIGPYDSKNQAIKDQQRLNRILRIRSELVKTQ